MAKTEKQEERKVEEVISKVIVLRRIVDETLTVRLRGITPVIPHKWSEKAKGMMRDAQQAGGKGVKPVREPKNPEADREACTYKLPDGSPGIPSVAFKAAMVDGCRFHAGFPMTDAKRMLYVEGEGPDQLIRIQDYVRIEREDTPRNATGVADLRYRYAYFPWFVTLSIRYPKGVLTEESVLALLDAGGRNGVCDWRPGSPKSNSGTFGQFRVEGYD